MRRLIDEANVDEANESEANVDEANIDKTNDQSNRRKNELMTRKGTT